MLNTCTVNGLTAMQRLIKPKDDTLPPGWRKEADGNYRQYETRHDGSPNLKRPVVVNGKQVEQSLRPTAWYKINELLSRATDKKLHVRWMTCPDCEGEGFRWVNNKSDLKNCHRCDGGNAPNARSNPNPCNPSAPTQILSWYVEATCCTTSRCAGRTFFYPMENARSMFWNQLPKMHYEKALQAFLQGTKRISTDNLDEALGDGRVRTRNILGVVCHERTVRPSNTNHRWRFSGKYWTPIRSKPTPIRV